MKNRPTRFAIGLAAAAICLWPMAASAAAGPAFPVTGINEGKEQLLSNLALYAGGQFGDRDGKRTQAAFRKPVSVTGLADGTVLVAEAGNHLVRAIKADSARVYAGTLPEADASGRLTGALLDGKPGQSFMGAPQGLAAAADGSVIVADAGNHAIRRIAADGSLTTIAGNGVLGMRDGRGAEAAFHAPQDVAVAADGTIYVADTLNHVIRKITPQGQVSTLTAAPDRYIEISPGAASVAGDYRDGAIALAKFNEPSGLALDASGNLYVSDTGNHVIRYIDFAAGRVETVAGTAGAYKPGALYGPDGYADGAAKAARFHAPKGLALTAEGGLVIADSLNHSVRYLLNGQVTTLAGGLQQQPGKTDGAERRASFDQPTDVWVRPDGVILVADALNSAIRSIEPLKLPDSLRADGVIDVLADGKPVEFEQRPLMKDGRVMVPVRAIAEALGYEVGYEPEPQAATLTRDGVTVRLFIGQNRLHTEIDGVPQTDAVLPDDYVAPFIDQSLTYVPVRFFSEQIGLDVQWHGDTETVILR